MPRSDKDSGRTDFKVALVPTGIKAGVFIGPCGVVITPLLPKAPFKVFSTLKEKDLFN